LIDQRLDVLVIDVLLAVGERLHPGEGVFQLVGAELVAHLLQLVDEGVAADTSFEARVSCVVSILFHHGNLSLRTLIAITISSSAALPARSPMPLTVHSIWRAPPATPASEFATAMPRSL